MLHSPSQGRRERNKAARKMRILKAARELIQEIGHVGFSMRGLAERSDLSVMTLYNLVGSQQEIILAICIEDMVSTTVEREALPYGDPLDEIFGMIPFIRASFSGSSRYRRAIVLSLFQQGAEHARQEVRDIYMTRWSRILEAARSQGLIRASTNIGQLLLALDNAYTTNIFSLSAGDISDEIFEARGQFAFALAISTAVSSAHSRRVKTLLDACRARCLELEPDGPFTVRELPEG